MPAPANSKIIVVDDEPAIVEIVTKMLTRCGYTIRSAYAGADAVDLAKEFRPDCIVTGIVMPNMDGLQEAVAVLKFLPDCKFVFFSGSAYKPVIRGEYARLGWDFRLLLQLPFQRPELLSALALAGFSCVDNSNQRGQ